jgi:hypothetical protein
MEMQETLQDVQGRIRGRGRSCMVGKTFSAVIKMRGFNLLPAADHWLPGIVGNPMFFYNFLCKIQPYQAFFSP